MRLPNRKERTGAPLAYAKRPISRIKIRYGKRLFDLERVVVRRLILLMSG